jgi:hypothetical protein
MTNNREEALKMMRSVGSIFVLGLATALGGCYSASYPACLTVCTAPYPSASVTANTPLPTAWDDPFAGYTQRIVTVSPTAGNAQAANAALQTATPWPRYSNNTNIPGAGARMVRAIQDYESGIVPPPAALGAAAGGGATAGGGAATGGGGSAVGN